jgi:hypothetical protein
MTAADTYLVFDTTDRFHSGAICQGESEVREVLAGLKNTTGYRVLRITEGELCRDLSDEFLSEPETADEFPEYERAAAASDRRYQRMMERV